MLRWLPSVTTSRTGSSISTAQDASVQTLAEDEEQALLQALRSLRPESAFALRTALLALQTPNVSGTLTMVIPRKTSDYPELTFRTGT